MIELINLDKDKKTIFYRLSKNVNKKIRIEVRETYTNSFIFSNELNMIFGVEYFTYIPVLWKELKIEFYDSENNNLICDFNIEGDVSLEECDVDGYLFSMQSKNNFSQQSGMNDVINEHLYRRSYRDIVDVEEGDIVVDIGFNYGIFSLGALKNGASRIYGFEPNKNIFNNLDLYPSKNKVEIYNMAVSDKNEILTFNEGYNTLGSSINSRVVDYKESYEVQCINFYEFIVDKKINKIDFLKIDCEGTEYEIFKTIPDNFFKTIKKIHVEFHENDGKRVYELIEKLERNNFEWFLEPNVSLNSNIGVIYAKQKTKKIVNISCYCDNENKLNVLRKNIDILKNNNFDICLISPLSLPDDIQKSVDYCLIVKENPVLDWPEHSMFAWCKFEDINGIDIYITTTYPDYGWAGLSHVKNGAKLFSNFDYDYYNFIIYDTILTDKVLGEINKGANCKFYPSKRNDEIWKSGLHLVIFDSKNIKKLINSIKKEKYILTDYDVFGYIEHIVIEENNFEVGEVLVEDEIFYYDNIDYFNHSDIDNLPFFVSSPDEYRDSLKIVFHKELPNNNIKIILNDNIIFNDIIQNSRIIDLGVYKEFIKNIKIEYNDCEYDITNTILNVKNSTLKLS